ncbi:MAG TPA: FHA domain-containing protein [Armatimonadota bacterium]
MQEFGATQQMSVSDKTVVTPAGGGQPTLLGTPVTCPICGTDNAPTEKYCGECGFLLSSTPVETAAPPVGEQPRLVSASGQGEFYLRQGANTVGREAADVLLSDPAVSRKHAGITLDGDKCWVEDFGSTNGTFVAGVQVGQGEKIEATDGAELKFGTLVFSLRLPEEAAEVEPAEETPVEESDLVQEVAPETGEGETVEISEPTEDNEPVLTEPPVVDVETVEETFPARLVSSADPSKVFNVREGVNSIGRRSGNDIVITDDPYVSGSHAQIVVDQLGMWLIDVGSTNGTTLNGSRINRDSRMALSGDDEIVFGQTKMRFTAEAG